MQAIEALHQRVSQAKLCDPAPSAEQRELIFKSALRAADHANLRPWRFVVVEGDDRERLGELYLAASLAENPDLDDARQQKILNMPFRAPMVLIAVAEYKAHAKVPEWELHLSAGAAVQNILNASFALGIGAYWRTGALAESEGVRRGLGLTAKDRVVGFIYLGTPEGRTKPVPELEVADYFETLKIQA
jgi:nitroreductase